MKKETEKIEIPFGSKDSEMYKFEYTIPEGYEAEIKDGKVIVTKKESEDERIRKILIHIVKGACDKYGIKYKGDEITEEKLLAYLEKQKEQKWSPSEREMGVLYKLCYINNQITGEDDAELTRLYQDLKREYFNGHSFENMFLNEKQKDKVVESDHDREQQPAEEDGPFDEDKFLEGELAAFLQNYDKEYDDDAAISDVAIHFYELGKKMKQKPAEWSEEDERMVEIAEECATNKDFVFETLEKQLSFLDWLKSLPERFNIKPKQEWSEEDEAAYNAFICEVINEKMNPTIEQIKWLRSICDRLKSLRPQPKQKWSEEFLRLMGITISQDGNQVCVLLGENLAEGIAGFGDTLADAVEEFKKEWRQFDRFRKATWKPSEEQIEALKVVARGFPADDPDAIDSLLTDLQKLL